MSSWSGLRLRSLFPFQTRFKLYKLFIFFGIILILFIFLRMGPKSQSSNESRPTRTLNPVSNRNSVLKSNCLFHTCFNINSCALRLEERIGVYVHIQYEYINSKSSVRYTSTVSDEYSELLTAVMNSPFYQPDITKACVFISSLDTLNQNRMDVNLITALLNSLPG